MTRRDKVRQAISHVKALQTGVWAIGAGEHAESARQPAFDVAAIDQQVQALTADEHAWECYFGACAVTPFRVVYEEFVQDYEGTQLALLDYLGLTPPPGAVFAPPAMQRQADALSDDWVERYLREKR